ncbi:MULTISPECIES: CRISPR-associated protein Cas4 [Eubacteriales]|uniref:CRISPR-associated protein Cas4 n=1 Tax=Eubacteriales TaxID=186802 RepID=UPI0008301E39|nr:MULTISPECIES: CRISPR-associated protein Cas4 [Anaerotruncus]RGX55598.1 CRISPR-associated protein Cas4 [Anaerotruncus sp. AF02-27]
MTSRQEEDYLPLSGLQHFAFCRRQWALIHIERQWAENLRTVEGQLLHQRAHDEKQMERRGNLLTARSLRVVSHRLRAQGVCDVVEFHQDPAGITLAGQDGTWQPYPVEYKKGRPNAYGADELQLCAQAICLEEMLLCSIAEGSLFYGEPRRRTRVNLDAPLRQRVEDMLGEMHALYARGYTPKATPSKGCNACSLKEVCLPRLAKAPPASAYLRMHLPREEESL